MNLTTADYVKIERLKLELGSLYKQREEGGRLQNAIEFNYQIARWVSLLALLLLLTPLGLWGLLVSVGSGVFAYRSHRLLASLTEDLQDLDRQITCVQQRIEEALAHLDKLQAY